MGQIRLVVSCNQPMILRSYLRSHAGISARLLTRLKMQRDGILCNGKPIRVIDTVQNGDILLLTLSEQPSFTEICYQDVPIVWESSELVIYNKPAGMPVHPSVRHRDDTLANVFAAHYPDCAFHALFRLDRNTSGLCAIAKSSYAAHHLQGAFQKKYYAMVAPALSDSGTVSAPIGRKEESVITRCVRTDGKNAVTHYRVLLETPQYSLVELVLDTGRTHQIRVHMSHIGHPLLGDDLYGGDCTQLSAHALHCGTLQFSENGNTHLLHAPLREDMASLLPDDFSLYDI